MAVLTIICFTGMTFAADITGSFSTKVLPKYVFGDGVLGYNSVVWQNDLFFNLPGGFSLDLWDSKGFNGRSYGNEWDATGAYAHCIDGTGVCYSVALAFYNLKPTGSIGKKDVISPIAEVNVDAGKNFKPYAKFELYIPSDGHTVEGTSRSTVGVSHHWQISDEIVLDQKGKVIYATGIGCRDAWVLGHELVLSWFPGKDKKLSVDIYNNIYVPLTRDTVRKDEVVPGLGATYRF